MHLYVFLQFRCLLQIHMTSNETWDHLCKAVLQKTLYTQTDILLKLLHSLKSFVCVFHYANILSHFCAASALVNCVAEWNLSLLAYFSHLSALILALAMDPRQSVAGTAWAKEHLAEGNPSPSLKWLSPLIWCKLIKSTVALLAWTSLSL